MCDMGLACLRVCMQAARSDETSWIKVDIAKDPGYPLSWFVVLAAHPSAGAMARLCCSHLRVHERSSAVSRWNRPPASFLWCSWSMKPQTVGHAVCNPNTVPVTSTASQLERKVCVMESVSQYVCVNYGAWLFEQYCQFDGERTYWQLQFPSIHQSIQLPVLAAIRHLSSVFVIILSQ